jgi:3-deoxy-D-manno-octulosonic-acid transferase
MTGTLTRAYMALRVLGQPLMRRALRRRLARGKEDAARIGERLGQPTAPRPEGRVVWVHAVGLGEVLALRPLLQAMQAQAPDLSFVITSVARSSAQVIAGNLPPRCTHQFLPLDGRDFVAAFLDHWRPALSVWSEQDLWPGAIHDCAGRGIPLAYVNARMNAESLRRRRRVAGLYRDTLARFALVAAQDDETAASLRALGADPVVTGSLKPAAAPLAADAEVVARLRTMLAGRRVWVAASTHAPDEAALIPAQAALWRADPAWLMILAPRLPQRSDEIAAALTAAGLPFARRSVGQVPEKGQAVWLADSFGDMGLWYLLAERAFVGGSNGGLGGHNPWEPLALGLPVLHGPDTANFAADYAALDAEGLATLVPADAGTLADAVQAPVADRAARAAALVQDARARLQPLAVRLLALIGGGA